MLRKPKYPFVPKPLREVGTVFIETGIKPAQTKGEKYVECSKVSEQQQRGQLSNSDNEFTAGVIGSI